MDAVVLLETTRMTIAAVIAIPLAASAVIARATIEVTILLVSPIAGMNPLLAHVAALLAVRLAMVLAVTALTASAVRLMMVRAVAIAFAMLQRASRPQLMMNITTDQTSLSSPRIITSIKCVTKNRSAVLSQSLTEIVGIVKVNYDISLVLWVRILHFGMLHVTTAPRHRPPGLQSRRTLQYSCV